MLDYFEIAADEMNIYDPELRLIFIKELKEKLCHSIHMAYVNAGLINSKEQA